jgi:Phage tail sheath C-terminal domain
MAQTLSSPGVSVSITDESAYTAAPAGTIPLIFVASASNKLTDAGTGIAPGTLAENDGKVYLLTGQKDLLDTFGTPVFKTDSSNNPKHAHEQNEYGLQAAYSYLGVANRAYVARATVDLSQLDGSPDIPEGIPEDGTFWIDTGVSKWGIFEWDASPSSGTGSTVTGQTFVNKIPTVITDTKLVTGSTPKSGVGAPGSYALVAVTSLVKLWYKKPAVGSLPAAWVEVGSPDWIASLPTIVSSQAVNDADVITTDTLVIGVAGAGAPQTFTNKETLAAFVTAINNNSTLQAAGITAAAINSKLNLFSTGASIDLDGTDTAAQASLHLSVTNSGTTSGSIYYAPLLSIAKHTLVPDYKIRTNNRPSGSIWIKTTSVNLGADLLLSKYSSASKAWIPQPISIYPNASSALNGLDSSGGGLNIIGNAVYAKTNDAEQVTSYTDTAGKTILAPSSASFKLYRRSATSATRIESVDIKKSSFAPSNAASFILSESVPGSDTLVTRTVSIPQIASDATVQQIADILVAAINNVQVGVTTNVHAVTVGTSKIAIIHSTGGEIEFAQTGVLPNTVLTKLFGTPDTNLTTAALNFYAHPGGNTTINSVVYHRYVASLWTEYTTDRSSAFMHLSDMEPTAGPAEGQLWFDSKIEEVDLMFCDIDPDTAKPKWVAFNNYNSGGFAKNPTGPFVTATKPKLQSDGSVLAEGDIWLDTSDLNNYPKIYRYIDFDKQWELINAADHTTQDGIVFADARWSTNGGADMGLISDMLGGFQEGGDLTFQQAADMNTAANFVDFDAPNPALYPKGMLLWNTRRSGYNVKKYHKTYVNPLHRNTRHSDEVMNTNNGYVTSRWVTESGNQDNGVGSFGYKAQRKVVVQSLQAMVNSNLQVRETEQRVFNLLATPGYPELVGEMRNLNTDRGLTAFIVADTPARLAANATDISNWGHNAKLATEDNDDGLVSADPYVAFFYPWGMASSNKGLNVVLPPSFMMLTTIALNDQKSWPWFAPAGTNRGVISNISSTGYVTSTGKYQTVSLNNGLRDTLADIKVNPITYLDGQGIVNFGQYTRSPDATALDRINVARLVVYLRRQLAKATRPYLFEPNDANTRAQAKHAVESIFTDVMSKRGLNDFLVRCDGTNNTPDRIDRSELWIDVAIQPMKAVEFIYIPLRLRNTGESLK